MMTLRQLSRFSNTRLLPRPSLAKSYTSITSTSFPHRRTFRSSRSNHELTAKQNASTSGQLWTIPSYLEQSQRAQGSEGLDKLPSTATIPVRQTSAKQVGCDAIGSAVLNEIKNTEQADADILITDPLARDADLVEGPIHLEGHANLVAGKSTAHETAREAASSGTSLNNDHSKRSSSKGIESTQLACPRRGSLMKGNGPVGRVETRIQHLSGICQATDEYWRNVERWQDVTKEEFLSYRWQVKNTIDRKDKLFTFLRECLPDKIPAHLSSISRSTTRDEFIEDVFEGMKDAPMAVRLTPHILSLFDWSDPANDPIRMQFLPLKSAMVEDHPALTYDSLHEADDSPVEGLVHRYPDKVLFLAVSVCPVYCRFCTRSYAIGANTDLVTKTSFKPTRKRWEPMFEYIEKTRTVQDVVISGGDSYYLQPAQIHEIGERLLSIPHVRRFRFATKGLGVCPSRVLDSGDGWTQAFIDVSNKARQMGKQVAMHTHINHPREVTWVTERAAQYLFEQGIVVRNQTVLLKGVNDDIETMSSLVRCLADLNIQPYYVYQGDLVKGTEDLRTPLSTILRLEEEIRGTIAGFMVPSFVVDLPGGGGKRLAATYESYDEESGVSTWKAPGVAGEKVFTYHDPKH